LKDRHRAPEDTEMKRWIAVAALLAAGILAGWQSSRCDDCVVFRERLPRTPEQQQAWQEHQHAEWEWQKRYDGRDFRRCLLKQGYDKCMGRSY
jgi:hypothetical protein